MTVVGRVRTGFTILAILLLVTATLYAVRYMAIDRPSTKDRHAEQGLTTVSQTIPTSVALYSVWVDKGLLYGGMMSGRPTVLNTAAAAARAALKSMDGKLTGPPQTRLVELRDSYTSFLATAEKVFAAEQAGNMVEARKLAVSTFQTLTDKTLQAIQDYRQSAASDLDTRGSSRDALSSTINLLLLVVFACAAAASIIMVLRIPSDIARMVRGVVTDLERTAAQVSAVSSQLASGAAQTAAAISEAATTVDEVRQTSMLASQKSSALSDQSQQAEAVADAGRSALAEIVEDMRDVQTQVAVVGESIVQLSERAEAIAELTRTSNDIAEQSNLLAVNAAIEAAKTSGEGKGFAVVADEIKSLALQSRDGVQQVRTVLNEIVKATTSAVDAAEASSVAIARSAARVDGSSEAIEALAETVEMTAQSSLQIAASSQQQLVGMDQISQSMEAIDDAGRHNAAAAREMAEEMASLRDVAERLRSMIGAGSDGEAARAQFAAVMGFGELEPREDEAAAADAAAPEATATS